MNQDKIKQAKKDLKQLKQELKRRENTPFYLTKNGFPSIGVILLVILLVIFTGVLLGIFFLIIYKKTRINALKKEIEYVEEFLASNKKSKDI